MIPTNIDQWAPFTIHPDGSVTQSDLYGPEPVILDDDDSEPEDSDGWTYLTGNTGQYGYHGAIMHPSEFLGGRMLENLFAEAAEDGPVTLVCVPVDDADGDSVGWAVAVRTA